MPSFDEWFVRATGNDPFPYQRRFAERRDTQLVDVPTRDRRHLHSTARLRLYLSVATRSRREALKPFEQDDRLPWSRRSKTT